MIKGLELRRLNLHFFSTSHWCEITCIFQKLSAISESEDKEKISNIYLSFAQTFNILFIINFYIHFNFF